MAQFADLGASALVRQVEQIDKLLTEEREETVKLRSEVRFLRESLEEEQAALTSMEHKLAEEVAIRKAYEVQLADLRKRHS